MYWHNFGTTDRYCQRVLVVHSVSILILVENSLTVCLFQFPCSFSFRLCWCLPKRMPRVMGSGGRLTKQDISAISHAILKVLQSAIWTSITMQLSLIIDIPKGLMPKLYAGKYILIYPHHAGYLGLNCHTYHEGLTSEASHALWTYFL